MKLRSAARAMRPHGQASAPSPQVWSGSVTEMPARRISRSPTLIAPAETTSGLKSRSSRASGGGAGAATGAGGSIRASGPVTGGAAVKLSGVTLRTVRAGSACSAGAPDDVSARSGSGAPALMDAVVSSGAVATADKSSAAVTATSAASGAIAQ